MGLCYTSGTTGNPKGVLYEHRSNVIHAITEVQPDAFDLSSRSVILPIVPMFHANSWGIPFAAATVGAKMVFSATNDAQVLCDLMHAEDVTHSAGVPTVWPRRGGVRDSSRATQSRAKVRNRLKPA